ncbi:hypothetical protein FZC79_22015 [Rossellomorea vietnamensis]|uniref:Uncharacterized protein n=1 Tax=Rossellomorea vietnamensis TaxID=218284 RepID=A0A5D4K652_9BACI|nr:hypothetical protein [Rossellomorea vietnamensis]TYR72702.1 hypothetical protein FZC79_22015 [Rossellomorea vietnamensis]
MGTIDITLPELVDLKEEINSFIELEFNNLDEQEKNHLRFILKRIVFLKYLIRQNGEDYRLNALTSDIMYLISSIKKGETRYYYFNLRSIIEQSLRLINGITSKDTISNASIMEKTQELVSEHSVEINLDIIKDEYNTSCLYVHGNEDAKMELAQFYNNCMENKPIKGLSQKLNVLVKLIKELFDLILVSQNSIVDAAYHRRKTILKFLVGQQSYQKFEQYKLD